MNSSTSKNILEKILVILILFCLLFSNSATLISYAVEEIIENLDSEQEIENTNQKIYKGVLYENILSEISDELTYNSDIEIKIQDIGGLEKINISNEIDKIISKDESTIDLDEIVYFRKIIISQEDFINIFGEEGYIKIFDSNGEQIHETNQNSDIDSEGNLIIGFDRFVSSITLETSKIQNQGNLEIKILKAIKHDNGFTEKQVDDFARIESDIKVEYFYKKLVEKAELSNQEEISANIEIDELEEKNPEENNSEEKKNNSIQLVDNIFNEQGTDLKSNEEKEEPEDKDANNSNIFQVIDSKNLDKIGTDLLNKEDNESEKELLVESEENMEEESNNEEILDEDSNDIENTEDNPSLSEEEIGEDEEVETKEIYEEYVTEDTVQTIVELLDIEGKVDLELSNTTWSTLSENSVKLIAVLKTDDYKYKLFENPTVEIELPEEIKNINITNVNILYKGELSLEKWNLESTDSKTRKIVIKLKGKQTSYDIGAVNGGLNIMIDFDFDLYKDTPTKNSNVKLTCTSNNEIYESEALVKLQAKTGILRSLSFNNTSTGEKQTSYENDVEEITVKNNITNQIINVKGKIINNFESEIENVEIVGRLPVEGNKDGYSYDLNSTFTTVLDSIIETSGNEVEIYYSEEIEADRQSDSWTQDEGNIENYKSFKIVLSENQMQQGEFVDFSFDIKIPHDVNYNSCSYGTYTVYYKLDEQELFVTCTSKLVTEIKEETEDEILREEEIKPNLTLTTRVSQCNKEITEEDYIYERQIVNYTVYVKNTSKVEINNVKIKADVKNANLYYLYYFDSNEYDLVNMETYFYYMEDEDSSKGFEEFTIDSLAPGEVKSFSYKGIAKEISEQEDIEMYSNIEVSADNIETQNLETIKNKIKNTKVSLKLEWAYRQMMGFNDVYGNSGLKYKIYIKNLSNEVLENQEINFVIPDSVEYNDYIIEGAEDYTVKTTKSGESTIITIVVPEIEIQEEKELYIPLLSKEVDTSKSSIEAVIWAYTNIDDEIIKSNEYVQTIYQNKILVDYTFNSDKTSADILKDDDLVTYTFTLKNIGIIDANYLDIQDRMQNGLSLEKVLFIQNGEEEEIELENTFRFLISGKSIAQDEEIKVVITAKVDENDLLYDQKTIENKLTINGGVYFDTFDTNVISLNVNNEKVTVDSVEEKEPDNNEADSDIDPDSFDRDISDEDDNDNSETNNNSQNEEKNSNANNNIANTVNNTTNNSDNKTANTNENKELNNANYTVKIVNTYRITGKAWLDKNKDGIYTYSEEILPGIEVSVYKVNAKGEIDDSNKIATAKTQTDGTYEIKGLTANKYIVVFEYDTELYTATTYQAKKAKSTENSDIITKKSSILNKTVGMTDVIEISNASLINIDAGFILNNEFDMSLEKYVDKIIVRNSKGVQETKFDREDLVKIEINSKLFEKSNVDIIYKIVIVNDGDISGYINKIVDYLPEGLTFKIEENEGWYQGQDGYLYYNGLIEKMLKAKSSKEIKLVLHAETNTVRSNIIENTAEIVEATNEKGLTDIDSIPNNKVEKEDDFGKVSALITLSTGKVINTLLITIITIIVVAVIIIVSVKIGKNNKFHK